MHTTFSLPPENIKKPYGFLSIQHGYNGNEWFNFPEKSFHSNIYLLSSFIPRNIKSGKF